MERSESQTISDKSQRYKTVQKLPKNFFEQILELELKLKQICESKKIIDLNSNLRLIYQ